VRIVFDTNVLFSAFTTHGVCAGLYEECLDRAEMVVSPGILDELAEKLIAKARLTPAEAREVIEAIRNDATVIDPAPLPPPACGDGDDDLILATALAGAADAIVTGDQDLLVLKKFQGIPIRNPRECLGLLAADPKS
jgi:putative PIN family toxin of toxin-antitoxin system